MSGTPRTDALLAPLRGSCAFTGPCAEHARQLERELDAALAEIARLTALIRRLHHAITARVSADDPTDEERLELMHAWTAAQETIDKAKL